MDMRHQAGPQRSDSVDSYLRETRAGAVLALLLLAAAIASEVFAEHTWERHPLIAGLVSSTVVVMLSAAIVNEAVEIRRRGRWSVLAQYVMLELVRNARMVWTGVLGIAGLMPGEDSPQSLEVAREIVNDTERVNAALREVVADPEQRCHVRDKVSLLVAHNDEVLGKWAAVMLNADAYAEVVDRHVELAGSLAWLSSLLAQAEPDGSDAARTHWARSSPAAQLGGAFDWDGLMGRLVAIAQLACQLDTGTLELAVRIVPVAWWEARLDSPTDAVVEVS